MKNQTKLSNQLNYYPANVVKHSIIQNSIIQPDSG